MTQNTGTAFNARSLRKLSSQRSRTCLIHGFCNNDNITAAAVLVLDLLYIFL